MEIIQGIKGLNHRCCDCMDCMKKGYGLSVKVTGLDAFLKDGLNQ